MYIDNMIRTVGFSQFCDAFRDMGREGSFSYKGKRALFDYLEEYEESTGEYVELDVIALDCEYVEYDSAIECATEYSTMWEIDKDATEEENEKSAMDFLEYHTQVIPVEGGGVIILSF